VEDTVAEMGLTESEYLEPTSLAVKGPERHSGGWKISLKVRLRAHPWQTLVILTKYLTSATRCDLTTAPSRVLCDAYFKVDPRTAPWRYVPVYLYWAVFDTQAAADAARAIDIVNLVKNGGASADVPVNADGSAGRCRLTVCKPACGFSAQNWNIINAIFSAQNWNIINCC